MKLGIQGLLTLLISLFVFTGCKLSSSELLVNSDNDIKGSLIDTLQVLTKTSPLDPILTGGLTLYPLGYVNDSQLGNTSAAISSSVLIPADAYSFGTNPVLDSAVLVLKLAPNSFYGDSLINTYQIEARQLVKTLLEENNFLSNKVHDTKTEVLGSFIGKIKPNSPVKFTNVVTGAKDTLVTSFPQIRIPLNKELINSLIVNAGPGNLATDKAFDTFFKGLQISVKNSQNPSLFGMFFVDFNSNAATYSGIELVYKRNNATIVGKRDTVKTLFAVTGKVSRIASTVTHDYEGTPTALALTKDFSTQNISYLIPLSGTKMEVKIPNLTNLAKLGKLIINKAELVLPVVPGTETAPFIPSPKIFIYTKDIAKKDVTITDGSLINSGNGTLSSNPALGGIYDATSKRYIFNITAYIQELLDGKSKDYGLYISHSFASGVTSPQGQITSSGVYSTFSSAQRSILASFTDPSGKKLKLNIYYTKVK